MKHLFLISNVEWIIIRDHLASYSQILANYGFIKGTSVISLRIYRITNIDITLGFGLVLALITLWCVHFSFACSEVNRIKFNREKAVDDSCPYWIFLFQLQCICFVTHFGNRYCNPGKFDLRFFHSWGNRVRHHCRSHRRTATSYNVLRCYILWS